MMKQRFSRQAILASFFTLVATLSVGPALVQGQDVFLRFNGFTQYVDVADNATLDITGAVTIEAWIFTEVITNPGRNRIVSKTGTNSGYEFALVDLGTGPMLEITLNQAVVLTTSFSSHLNKWTHVAVTWDGSQWARLYINGAQAAVGFHASAIVANAELFVIGLRSNHSTSQGQYLAIDEVRVWSAQVSQTNLAAWKDIPLTNAHANWASLEGNWRLDEGSGQLAASEVNAAANVGRLGSSAGVDTKDPTWVGGTAAAAQDNHNITVPTEQVFDGTATTVDFTSVTGGGNVTVSRYQGAPSNVTGVTEPDVPDFWWVIEAVDGFAFGSDTEVRFKLADIPGATIPSPGSVVVYKRDAAGIGTFTAVSTTWDSVNGEIVVTGFTSFSEFIFAHDASLPVELASFEVTLTDKGASLQWETLSELDNAGFEVQISRENGEFSAIGFVEGHGTTDEYHKYLFVAHDLEPGQRAFRLKQIDFDGAFTYSPTVEAIIEVPGEYFLNPAYPNPFNPSTIIRFGVARTQDVKAVLYNGIGQAVRVLFEGNVSANEMQSLRIEAGSLPSGTYSVRLSGESFNAVEHITLVK